MIATNPTAELQEHGCAVFIGGDRSAECEKAEVLENVVERVKSGVSREPRAISLREQIWREGTQAEQVIASIHHHVDGEIVPSIDTEIGSNGIADQEARPFQIATEGGVFGTGAVFDFEKPPKNVHGVNASEGREHGTQLESNEFRGSGPEALVGGDNRLVGLTGETVALEDDRCSPSVLDFVHPSCVSIEVEAGAGLITHEGAGEVASAAENGVGKAEGFFSCGVIDEVAVAGVHVDGGDESRVGGTFDMTGEAIPIDVPIFVERQEDGGIAFDAASRPKHLDGVKGDIVHGLDSRVL